MCLLFYVPFIYVLFICLPFVCVPFVCLLHRWVDPLALAWDMPVNDHPPPIGVADMDTFIQRFTRGGTESVL